MCRNVKHKARSWTTMDRGIRGTVRRNRGLLYTGTQHRGSPQSTIQIALCTISSPIFHSLSQLHQRDTHPRRPIARLVLSSSPLSHCTLLYTTSYSTPPGAAQRFGQRHGLLASHIVSEPPLAQPAAAMTRSLLQSFTALGQGVARCVRPAAAWPAPVMPCRAMGTVSGVSETLRRQRALRVQR